MIIREQINEVIYCMSDAAILAASVKAALIEVAKQAEGLAMGLQNAAPAEKTGTPNNSIQYLLNIADSINTMAADYEKIQPSK